MPAQTAQIARNDVIATATKELVIKTSSPFTFTPGQYITILVPTPDGKKLGRSYSIASQKTTDGEITLVVKIVPGGLGSTYIDKMQPGDQIEFLGPLGRFQLSTLPKDYLFVATGTGIAPFVPMIRKLLDEKTSQKITCLLGFRHAEDAFYAELLQSWASENPNLNFICALSQPGADWTGGKGRVTNYLIENKELLYDVQIYICGNGSMINEVAQIGQDNGNPKEQIFFEKYNNL